MIVLPNPPINVVEYHRAVEIRHMRRLMLYGQEAFEEDWNVALALAIICAEKDVREPDPRHRMLDSCFQRILAYISNNPDARPF
jgi:hypothetical protein